jgi:hypothetical protein
MENGRKAEDVAREIGVSKHNHLRLEAEVPRICPLSPSNIISEAELVRDCRFAFF